MTKTDHVDFEEQELRQAIERDVAAAGLWDTCAECGLAPEKELAFINERLVEGGYEPFGTLSDLREAAAHARHKFPDLVKEFCSVREC